MSPNRQCNLADICCTLVGSCLGWLKLLIGVRALWKRNDWHKNASTVDGFEKHSRKMCVLRLAWCKWSERGPEE